MSKIELKKINKYFGKNHVLKDIDLTIEGGDFMTLLGPSGCGKTTTLRAITGLEDPEEGIITIGEKEIVNCDKNYYTPSSKRDLGLVFQSYALWPHMTVFENVSFGLKVKKMSKSIVVEKVDAALDKMQILHLKDRYPSELSGGQQQRVAIARAIVTEPKILLLDEPLSNLDAKLRLEMRTELKRLHKELETTIVYVTHDQIEALTLSTKIAVFFEGNLAQVDEPMNIYRKPADLHVANFVGNPKINLVDGYATCTNGQMHIESSVGKFSLPSNNKFNGEIVLSVYPEDIVISDKPVNHGIKCTVDSNLPAGSETLVQLITEDGTNLLARAMGEYSYSINEELWITFPFNKTNIYNKETSKIMKCLKEEELLTEAK